VSQRASLSTSAGRLWMESDGTSILRLGWWPADAAAAPEAIAADPLLTEGLGQLRAYFDGRLKRFDLPLPPPRSERGKVLRDAIAAIPFGETRSYGMVARLVGSGARAVGQACARNPLPIIIPCHRVTGAGGALGAYSAGEGVRTKKILLDLENIIL